MPIWYPSVEECPLCDQNGNQKCIYCNGSGRLNKPGRPQCGNCIGTGVKISRSMTEPEMAVICDHKER